ncbi:diguanylate cyclase [Thermovirga lienii DSM 17291]|uniref:Diguanylate cyclase n=1 Tax=Thermovirga lienii (strain ATCC BAA-1197 / DSM 17291 / Cas60314) TaxID=580340 RepID=G7V930_THELD|nr:diguanylate cyclase [Thermovirga lienii]AER67564.1 diguanylate cyclase [Thermovirga lienii DSM 17291]
MKYSFLRRSLIFLFSILALETLIILVVCAAIWSQFNHMASERHRTLQENIGVVLEEVNNVYDFVAKDYSWWDEMVEFLSTEDQLWAADNIALDSLLSQYVVDGIAVVNRSGKVIFQDGVATDALLEGYIRKLNFKKPEFKHFYGTFGDSTVMYYIAPIQPGGDVERRSVPQGYLFVIKVIDAHYLGRLALLTNCSVTFAAKEPEPQLGLVSVPLRGDHGKPVGYLVFRELDPLLPMGKKLLVSLSLIALGTSISFGLLIIGYVYFRFIKPLKDMGKALLDKDPDQISGYARKRGEIGNIADAVSRFIEYFRVDPLTGLRSRHEMETILERYIERAKDQHFSIIMADLDNFKDLNDTYGHKVGDEILAEFGRLIRDCIRVNDLAFRYGGEEFLIILPGANFYEAAECAERMRKKLKDATICKGITVSASFGVAEYQENDTASSLLERADRALYRAKAQGKNRVEVLIGIDT